MILMKFTSLFAAATFAASVIVLTCSWSARPTTAWSTNSKCSRISRRRGFGRSGVPVFETPKSWEGQMDGKNASGEADKYKGVSTASAKNKLRKSRKASAAKKGKGSDTTGKTKGGETASKVYKSDPMPPSMPVQPVDANAQWNWKPLDLQLFPEVQKYLSCNVDAVELPEKVQGDETFPGLIIDGASGVGKTQQAFALLNDGKHKVVYLLMIDGSSETSQVIYRKMTSLTGMSGFLQKVDSARKEVAAHTSEQGKDPFSVANIYGLLNSNIAPLDGLVHFMADRVLKYNQEGLQILSWTITSEKRAVADSIKCLNGKVLFLDEVLPPPKANDPSDQALSRLRFVRNLGRALGMRVVMAGTAATAANMISLRNKDAGAAEEASRIGEAEIGWMEIQFLWSPVQLPGLVGSNLYTKHKERPYLVSLLENMPDSCRESEITILQHLAGKIDDNKNFSDEGKLIWLSGCWLSSEDSTLPPSPFAMGPADLVKGHFFEPALAITDENKPHTGESFENRLRLKGPLRFALQRYKDKKIIWWALLSHSMDAGYTSDFQGIERALKHCAQSCLATEPVLAVSLSISHTMSPGNFRKAFLKSWNESPQQLTVGEMDGELNEYLQFAALQMACRSDNGASFPHTRTVADMVKRLWEYLSPEQPESPSSKVLQEVRDRSGYNRTGYSNVNPSPKEIKYSYGFEGNENVNSIKNLHKKTRMPWLVPACSHGRLEAKIKETQQRGEELSLFREMSIAGLVPGCTNCDLDAAAYLWGSDDLSNSATLEWTFEFKCRQGSYSLKNATTDLVRKCNAFSATNKVNVGDFHSMIVVFTGNKKSECRIWLQDEKLRIALLVGSRRRVPNKDD